MFKIVTLLVLSILLTATGCVKNPVAQLAESRYCWQVIDNFGNPLQQICNKSETEIKALYPNSCNYYKSSGEKFCWFADGMFLENMTKEGADMHVRCFRPNAGAPVKIGCNYCQQWYHRIKSTFKPDNSFTYSPVRVERFCGDTVTTLFQGRQVVLKNTPDSLIVRQFSNNGTSW